MSFWEQRWRSTRKLLNGKVQKSRIHKCSFTFSWNHSPLSDQCLSVKSFNAHLSVPSSELRKYIWVDIHDSSFIHVSDRLMDHLEQPIQMLENHVMGRQTQRLKRQICDLNTLVGVTSQGDTKQDVVSSERQEIFINKCMAVLSHPPQYITSYIVLNTLCTRFSQVCSCFLNKRQGLDWGRM